MKTVLFVIAGLVTVVFGIWFVAIPESLIHDLIEKPINTNGVYLKAEGLNKGLFYSLTIKRAVLNKKDQGKDVEILMFDNVNARVDFMSLLKFRPALRFKCKLNNGMVDGRTVVSGKGLDFIADGRGINIDGIGAVEHYGVRGKGTLSGSLYYRDGSGEAKFLVEDARLQNTSINNAYIPLSLFNTIRGALIMKNQAIQVQSLTLEGAGVNARVKGDISGSKPDMDIELMIDASFKTEPLIMMMIERYRVSPGYYLIPVKAATIT